MDDIAVLNRCGTDVAISVCMVGVKSLRITRYENQLNISTVWTHNSVFRLHMTLVLCSFTGPCSASAWKFIFSDPMVRKLLMLTVYLREDEKCSATGASSNWSFFFCAFSVEWLEHEFLLRPISVLGEGDQLTSLVGWLWHWYLVKWPVLWTSPNYTFSAPKTVTVKPWYSELQCNEILTIMKYFTFCHFLRRTPWITTSI